MNSLAPLYTGANLGLPVVDADGMGRAFPEVNMIAPFIYDHTALPAAVSDEKGNQVLCSEVEGDSVKAVEKFLREQAVALGLFVGLAFYPFPKALIKETFVPYSISRCWRLGRAILKARKEKTSPLNVIQEEENGKLIFKGKIVDLERKIERGYNFGKI